MNLLILSSLPSVASVQMLLNQAQGLGLRTRIVSPQGLFDFLPTIPVY